MTLCLVYSRIFWRRWSRQHLAIANSSSRRPRTDRRDPVRHRGWPREADNVAMYISCPTPRQGPSGARTICHSAFPIRNRPKGLGYRRRISSQRGGPTSGAFPNITLASALRPPPVFRRLFLNQFYFAALDFFTPDLMPVVPDFIQQFADCIGDFAQTARLFLPLLLNHQIRNKCRLHASEGFGQVDVKTRGDF